MKKKKKQQGDVFDNDVLPDSNNIDSDSEDSEKYSGSDSESFDSDKSSSDEDNDEDVDCKKGVKKRKKVNPFFKSDQTKRDESNETEEETSKVDENDDEDDLIRALKASKERRVRNSPQDIRYILKSITDVSFHLENDNLIAVASEEGDVRLFEVSNESNLAKKSFEVHKKRVNSVEFGLDQTSLLTAASDRAWKIVDVEASKVKLKCLGAHSSPITKIKGLSEHVLVTGDDLGSVKLWDIRVSKRESVMDEKPFDEHVTDFFADHQHLRTLVAASAEGTLGSFNVRGRRLELQSEVYPGELNAFALVHHDSKLVTACGDGRLYMFDWKEKAFGYHSADFPGHPESINDVKGVTENIVVTACEDGVIRAVHLYPNKFIGTVGHHENHLGVERLDINASGHILASVSHDNSVKFWNLGYLETMDYRKRRKPFYSERQVKSRRLKRKETQAMEEEHQLPSSHKLNKRDFFADMPEDIEDDEDQIHSEATATTTATTTTESTNHEAEQS